MPHKIINGRSYQVVEEGVVKFTQGDAMFSKFRLIPLKVLNQRLHLYQDLSKFLRDKYMAASKKFNPDYLPSLEARLERDGKKDIVLKLVGY